MAMLTLFHKTAKIEVLVDCSPLYVELHQIGCNYGRNFLLGEMREEFIRDLIVSRVYDRGTSVPPNRWGSPMFPIPNRHNLSEWRILED